MRVPQWMSTKQLEQCDSRGVTVQRQTCKQNKTADSSIHTKSKVHLQSSTISVRPAAVIAVLNSSVGSVCLKFMLSDLKVPVSSPKEHLKMFALTNQQSKPHIFSLPCLFHLYLPLLSVLRAWPEAWLAPHSSWQPLKVGCAILEKDSWYSLTLTFGAYVLTVHWMFCVWAVKDRW